MMAEGTDLYSRVFLGHDQGQQQPASDPIPLNDSDDAEVRAQKVLRDLASAEGAYNAWAPQAREEMRFYHGHQWDDIDRLRMEQTKRPAITFNQIKPAIDAISGLERLNRSDVRFVTRALDSVAVMDLAGDLASEAISTVDDLCNGPEELSRVAKDAVICGMGWAEVRMDYSQDLNGRVIYERVPPHELRWDPNNADKDNLEGSTWRARKKPLSRKVFKQLFGEDKLAAVDLAVPDMPYGSVDRYELVTPYYSRANEQANPQVGGGVAKKDIVVIQYQWLELQPVYRFIDETTGEESHLDDPQWQRLKQRSQVLGSSPPPAVKQMQPIHRQGYYCRGVELEEPVDLPAGFSLLPMTGIWDDDRKRWYGVVRGMIDPQKVQNKAISSSIAFHISNAKGGVLFKPRAFDDPRRAQDSWSQPDAWIPVTDDADIHNDIVPRQPSQLPAELPMFYQEAQQALVQVSGVTPEMLGQAQGQTPSQTAQGRTQAALVILGGFFDNLKRHHKDKAVVQLEFVREYWTQGQLIQVGGDELNQAVPLLKESLPERWHYSLVLDDSIRHNPNLKAQIWDQLTTSGVLQALMKFGLGQVILKLLKYSPFPSQLVQDILRDIQQNPPPPPQKGRAAQQGAAPGQRGGSKPPDPPQKIAADVMLRQAQAHKALAQAREIDMRAGATKPKLALQALAQGHSMNLDQQKQAHEERKHAHQQKMDVGNALLKSMGSFPGQQQPGAQPGPPQEQPNGGQQ